MAQFQAREDKRQNKQKRANEQIVYRAASKQKVAFPTE
ncbi:hypothetical protein MBUL_02228 [Methylobacterium bullatum]|uniref:Uncharacterized protein n=1 Tax=Methylobacterium bullatum TaxID=570505 RepID=A0A679IX53_9HYPH|nr:hypothetical protein MBUL_02228 [Methylobacterium bullatum]